MVKITKVQKRVFDVIKLLAVAGEPIRHHDIVGRGIPISAVEALEKKGLVQKIDLPEGAWVLAEVSSNTDLKPQ